MAQYLLTAPQPRVVAKPKLDEKGNQIIDADGKLVVEIDQIVSPLTAYDMALQTVTSGPKLFEVWALRKRIKEATVPNLPFESAKYLILSDEEKEVLVQGFKTIDWTFQQKHTFWVEWEQLFDSISDIAVFDEKSPPAAYVTWKNEYERKAEERKAEQREIERKAVEAEEAKKAKRNTAIAKLVSSRLADALALKIGEGKLGQAATTDDLPVSLIDAIKTGAAAEYDANPAAFDEPVPADVIVTEATPVVAEALVAADAVESAPVEG